MTTVRNVWTILSLAGCAALVACQLLDFGMAAAVAKLTASSAFIAVAISCGATESGWGRALLAGLAASWFGDAFLLGSGTTWFLLGLAAFLLAHVAYIVAFLIRGLHVYWLLAAALPVLAISAGVAFWLMPYVGNPLRAPVLTYLVIINLMVMSSIGARGAGAPLLIPAGAIAFYLSDLGVAARQFMEPEFPPYVWSLPLYYAGQLMLARSTGSADAVSRRRSPPR